MEVLDNSRCVSVWVSKGRAVHNGNSSIIAYDSKAIYSYGKHFPLAVEVKEDKHCNRVLLCNADRYGSVTTSKHQNYFFTHGLPHVPFSALEAAGIGGYNQTKFKDIEIIDKQKDKQREIEYTNSKGELAKRWEHSPGGVLIKFKRILDSNKFTYILCGMDENHYFVCELPQKVNTIEEAFDSLKPDSVRLFENDGHQVLRQGDIYFVRRDDISLKSVKKLTVKNLHINNTHVASSGYEDALGNTYVEGTVKHTKGEHKNLKLTSGDEKIHTTMYLVVMNLKVNAWGPKGIID